MDIKYVYGVPHAQIELAQMYGHSPYNISKLHENMILGAL